MKEDVTRKYVLMVSKRTLPVRFMPASVADTATCAVNEKRVRKARTSFCNSIVVQNGYNSTVVNLYQRLTTCDGRELQV